MSDTARIAQAPIEDFVILFDEHEDHLKAKQLSELCRQLTGLPLKNFLLDLFQAVKEKDQWSALSLIKSATGEHIAEANELYQRLMKI